MFFVILLGLLFIIVMSLRRLNKIKEVESSKAYSWGLHSVGSYNFLGVRIISWNVRGLGKANKESGLRYSHEMQ